MSKRDDAERAVLAKLAEEQAQQTGPVAWMVESKWGLTPWQRHRPYLDQASAQKVAETMLSKEYPPEVRISALFVTSEAIPVYDYHDRVRLVGGYWFALPTGTGSDVGPFGSKADALAWLLNDSYAIERENKGRRGTS